MMKKACRDAGFFILSKKIFLKLFTLSVYPVKNRKSKVAQNRPKSSKKDRFLYENGLFCVSECRDLNPRPLGPELRNYMILL